MAETLGVYLQGPAENLQLPDPALATYYKNFNNRILWLDSNVDETWLEYEKVILLWNKEDMESNIPVEERIPIKLFIYSYGGSLDINYSFIDIIETSTTPIIGINMGQACSAACFIYLACKTRYTFPHSAFLIHQGGVDGGFSGTYEQVVAAIMEYQRQMDVLAKYIMAHTNITQEEMDENFSSDWYLSAEEAVEKGVAHKIITSLEEIIK